jgi:tRNA (guanine-N7-)-methyltransferase
MPHIFLKDFPKNRFRQKSALEETSFLLLGESMKNRDNHILLTEFRDKTFFLQIKKRDGKWLVKSEKSSRVSPNYPIHQAIDRFREVCDEVPLFSNLNLKESQHISKENRLKFVSFFGKEFWKREKKFEIEVGFGSGRHLLHRAENSPDTIFIGIEIHKPSIEQVLKQIEIRKLENIYLLDFDARYFLETVPSNMVDAIYVHFPVPWDKSEKRRVINPTFIKESKRVLKVGGILELRTDSENYFQWSLGLFLKERHLEMELLKNISIDVESKYESRWLKLEKNIYNFRVKSLENSPEEKKIEKIEKSFFRDRDDLSHLSKLLGEKILRDEWFISFIDIYTVSDKSFIIHIIGGSYQYPEGRFLFVNRNKIEYLIKKPLEIEVNLAIDKYLRELL